MLSAEQKAACVKISRDMKGRASDMLLKSVGVTPLSRQAKKDPPPLIAKIQNQRHFTLEPATHVDVENPFEC